MLAGASTVGPRLYAETIMFQSKLGLKLSNSLSA